MEKINVVKNAGFTISKVSEFLDLPLNLPIMVNGKKCILVQNVGNKNITMVLIQEYVYRTNEKYDSFNIYDALNILGIKRYYTDICDISIIEDYMIGSGDNTMFDPDTDYYIRIDRSGFRLEIDFFQEENARCEINTYIDFYSEDNLYTDRQQIFIDLNKDNVINYYDIFHDEMTKDHIDIIEEKLNEITDIFKHSIKILKNKKIYKEF